jgi:hypothetical protein
VFAARLLALTGALFAAGCGTPAGGDPGGKRLSELSHDPVFAAVPRGATMVKLTQTPARYRQPAFQTGGWDGPSVMLMFRSSSPPALVYRFYGRRAKAAGWHGIASGALGFTDRWRKRYPDGAAAYLSLSLLTPPPTASRRLYMLGGGVAPVVH